jgi:hypothetical protein
MKEIIEGGREIETLEGIKIQKVESKAIKSKLKESAIEALQNSDISKVFEVLGVKDTKEMNAAMKTVLAEKITEYAVGAMDEARKRNMGFSAATIIIAANKRK